MLTLKKNINENFYLNDSDLFQAIFVLLQQQYIVVKKINTPKKLEFADNFVAIPLVGIIEFAVYGLFIWIIDLFLI